MPNLYPALERQEVVVHSPRHVRSFAELAEAEVVQVAIAWQERARAAADAEFPYLHAMINEGQLAGASLAHSHSQLTWLREPPPAVRRERREGCAVCELVAQSEPLVLKESGNVLSFVHPAGRAPYELLITLKSGHDSAPFVGNGVIVLLQFLRDAIQRLRAVEGPISWNAWFHLGEHPHIEVVPRLTAFAGLELGAEIYVNVVSPEHAAETMRSGGE